MAKLVSKTYGDALFEIAAEENRLDAFMEEAKGIQQVLKENVELSRIMTHPKIVKEEKIQIIENVFKGQVSDEMVGLMRMVTEKDRFGELDAILQYFIELVKEEEKIGTAYVTTPLELSESQKAALVKQLIATTKYVEFEMHYHVDKALIGGMVIRIGDRVIDSSVSTKLQNLSLELSKIQLKVGEGTP